MVGIRRSTTSLNRGDPLYADVVGRWKLPQFMGAGGLIPDLSGQGNHGTLTNMDPAEAWVGTEYGSALNFDGIDDVVVIQDRPEFAISKHTVVATFMPKRLSGVQVIVERVNLGVTFNIFTSGSTLTTYVGGNFTDFSTALSVGEWYHAVVTYDGVTVTGYLNGRQDASAARAVTVDSSAYFTIGSRYGSNFPYNGLIGDVSVSSVSHGVASVAAMYDQWRRGSTDALWRPRGLSMVSVPAAGGGATPWLYARRQAQIIGGGMGL